MANGNNVAYCATCTNFKSVQLGNVASDLRSAQTDCQCLVHRIHLPFSKTDQLLICSDWIDYRGLNAVSRWNEKFRKKIKSGILYSYPDEYSSEFREYSAIANLEKL